MRDRFRECGECDDCREFCKGGRDDFDAIDDIEKGLVEIAKALRAVEKNRVCEGIREIEHSIKHTEEGLHDICDTLRKAFKFGI